METRSHPSNCLDVRRQALTTPLKLTLQQSDHVAVCTACADFVRSVLQAEGALQRALHVPVPPGLERRVARSRLTRSLR